jgi:hypothetical protein
VRRVLINGDCKDSESQPTLLSSTLATPQPKHKDKGDHRETDSGNQCIFKDMRPNDAQASACGKSGKREWRIAHVAAMHLFPRVVFPIRMHAWYNGGVKVSRQKVLPSAALHAN